MPSFTINMPFPSPSSEVVPRLRKSLSITTTTTVSKVKRAFSKKSLDSTFTLEEEDTPVPTPSVMNLFTEQSYSDVPSYFTRRALAAAPDLSPLIETSITSSSSPDSPSLPQSSSGSSSIISVPPAYSDLSGFVYIKDIFPPQGRLDDQKGSGIPEVRSPIPTVPAPLFTPGFNFIANPDYLNDLLKTPAGRSTISLIPQYERSMQGTPEFRFVIPLDETEDEDVASLQSPTHLSPTSPPTPLTPSFTPSPSFTPAASLTPAPTPLLPTLLMIFQTLSEIVLTILRPKVTDNIATQIFRVYVLHIVFTTVFTIVLVGLVLTFIPFGEVLGVVGLVLWEGVGTAIGKYGEFEADLASAGLLGLNAAPLMYYYTVMSSSES